MFLLPGVHPKLNFLVPVQHVWGWEVGKYVAPMFPQACGAAVTDLREVRRRERDVHCVREWGGEWGGMDGFGGIEEICMEEAVGRVLGWL